MLVMMLVSLTPTLRSVLTVLHLLDRLTMWGDSCHSSTVPTRFLLEQYL